MALILNDGGFCVNSVITSHIGPILNHRPGRWDSAQGPSPMRHA